MPNQDQPTQDDLDRQQAIHRAMIADIERMQREIRDRSGYVTKDSGKREQFDTGARRDVEDDKPAYDQIPVFPLERLAYVYTRGAKKYGRNNWKKGIRFCRMMASALRHVFAWAKGEVDEDHLAQAAWNLFGLMYYEWAIAHGKLPASLDDRDLPPKVTNARELANLVTNAPLPEAPICPDTKLKCGRVPPCVSSALCKNNTEADNA